jgi:5-methylcytosine-specific restriction protein B
LRFTYWRERFATNPEDLKRFKWARFYQAFAEGLLKYRSDRRPLIGFLQALSGHLDALNFLKGDQFADGRKGFIQDIDPFTLIGLFNRGIKDSSRQSIAKQLAEFLNIEETIPDSFEGIPVLNNQKSWFFPYAKNRPSEQIDSLWEVFSAGLKYATILMKSINRTFAKALMRQWQILVSHGTSHLGSIGYDLGNSLRSMSAHAATSVRNCDSPSVAMVRKSAAMHLIICR